MVDFEISKMNCKYVSPTPLDTQRDDYGEETKEGTENKLKEECK